MVGKLTEVWKEHVAEYQIQKQREEEIKQEREERLKFEGKYSTAFLRVIWKNFRYNWRTYRIFAVVGTFSVSLIFAGFGMWEVLKDCHANENLALGQGLGTILLSFLMMILIISTCLIIVVLMYYLKNHVKNYGIFVTLGMRKQTLYAFMAVELISCMLISLFLGVLFGRIVSFMCCRGITGIAGIKLALGKITYKTYLLTAISTMVMFLLSVLFTHEVYIDTGASVSGKKEIEREKMPGQFARLGLIVGLIIITFSVIRYSSYTNFEGTQNLVLFLAGIYLVLRNGLVEILNQRKQKIGKYFGTLLKNNQFYYRYKSTVRYIFLFTIVNFCVLFVFAKGMLSALIAEQTDKQFPYDFVCMAIEEDEDIFEKIRDKYDVKMYQFPMVRVANADNSREPDNSVAPIFPQGQEIGISESTYQELCRLQGWEVEEKELAADGSDVKIVFQQDESVEAHPIDYFVGTKKPFLHIGQPVQYYEFQYRKQIFAPRKVRGIKTGALIGNLRQGKHENIVVFSDEYFESVKDDWKRIDINSGRPFEGEAIEGLNKHHWPTQLVLIKAEKKDLKKIEQRLAGFDDRHRFDNKIDSTVLSHYSKTKLIGERESEGLMNIVTNGFVILILLIVSFVLMYLKSEGELEEKKRQGEFLKCMGMTRKERRSLFRREREIFLWVPMGIGTLISIPFTLMIFNLRQYSAAESVSYLKLWGILFIVFFIIQYVGTKIFEIYMLKKIEG